MSLGVVDLFCGAGGLGLGLESLGCDLKLSVDNDEDSINTLKANSRNGSIAINEDLFEFNLHSVKEVG